LLPIAAIEVNVAGAEVNTEAVRVRMGQVASEIEVQRAARVVYAMDFCGFDTFTSPTDIRPLVASLTGFNVTSDNVPTTGLTSDQVKDQVVRLAASFFSKALQPQQSQQ
jgi:hypothetical protein